MPITCLNCGTEITDKFCPHCGQKKDVQKLAWHSLLHEIVHFFSHVEHGFLNTSYQLLLRPGRVIREYLEGKREKYQKPISLYLIWVGIHLLAYNLITGWMHYENYRTGNFILSASAETRDYIVHHPNIFGFLLLPILSFFVWLIISPKKMNYIENLVLGIYMFAAFEMLIFFQIIITGLLFSTNFLTNKFVTEIQVVNLTWSSFALVSFFRNEKIKFLILRVLLASVVALLVFHKLSVVIADLILSFKH